MNFAELIANMDNRVVRTYSRRSAKKPRLECVNERPVNLFEDNEDIPDINLQWLEEYDKHNVSSCAASERLKSTVEIIKKQDATIKYLKKRNAELQESVKSYKTLIMIMKQKDMVSKPEKIISDIMDPPDIPKSVKDICESVLLEPCFIDVKEVASDEQVENDAPDTEGSLQEEPDSSEDNVNPIASAEILKVKEEPDDRTSQNEIADLRECNSDIVFETIKMEVEDEEGLNTIPKEPNYNKELNELEFNFIKSQIETGSGENLEVHHIDIESADNLLLGELEAGPSDDLEIEDDFKEEITITETNLVDKQLSDSENVASGSKGKRRAANQAAGRKAKTTSRRKQRKVNYLEWKRTKRKLLRDSGQAYINEAGKLVKERPKPTYELNCKCQRPGCKEMTIPRKMFLFEQYYNMNYNEQSQYLMDCITMKKPARRRSRNNSEIIRRCFTYYYNVDGFHVCMNMFIHIFGITKRRISTIQKHMKNGYITAPSDGRGKHKNRPHARAYKQRYQNIRTY